VGVLVGGLEMGLEAMRQRTYLSNGEVLFLNFWYFHLEWIISIVFLLN